jgi:capsular polysaccharide biosynthesis protein
MIDFLRGEGWAIIQAEKYSLKQQIGLFRNARAVCSIHGAGLTNLLWCDKGCKVLELCAANYLNGSLEGLALCLGLDHRFLVYPADDKFRIRVDMEEFKSAIKAMA